MSGKVHRVKGKPIVRAYRLLPYSDIAQVLKEDGVAFLEDSRDHPLNRGTIWKGARKLSEMIDQKVIAERVFVTLENGSGLEGYLFSQVNYKLQRRKEKSV